MTQPVVYMIAGPNGAGKTTLALETMPKFFSVHEFVNADEIARGMNPLNPEGHAIMAGRWMLQRIDDLIAAKTSFSFETTGARADRDKVGAFDAPSVRVNLLDKQKLRAFPVNKDRANLFGKRSSHGFASKIKQAKAAGYNLGYFMPGCRMRKPPRAGSNSAFRRGANIPEPTIERRYARSIRNLVNLYLPLADKADIYNGAAAQGSHKRVIAAKSDGNFVVYQPVLWDNIKYMADRQGDGDADK